MRNVVLVDKRGLKVATVTIPPEPGKPEIIQRLPGVVVRDGIAYVRDDRGRYLETLVYFAEGEPKAKPAARAKAKEQQHEAAPAE